ncbi:hypothetical protein V8C86DRAFT_971624 [Haematococcus lacustris]
MRSLLHELTCSPRPWRSIGWGLRLAVITVTDLPSRTISAPAQALRQYDWPPQPKQDMGELIIAVVKLPHLNYSIQVEQTSQRILWRFADWARQPENSRAGMIKAKSIPMLKLLQRMAVEPWTGTAGNPPAPLEQFDARQLSKAAWSLGKLKPHLPAAAATPRPGHSIDGGCRLGGNLRSPAPRTCLLPWLPSIPSRTLSSSAHSERWKPAGPTCFQHSLLLRGSTATASCCLPPT